MKGAGGIAAVLLAACAWLPLPACAQPENLKFYGYAYELASGRYLYTEVHDQRVDNGHWRGGIIRYYAPDATLLGEKSLDFSRDPYVPLYRFDMRADGYFEAITHVAGEVTLQRRRSRQDALREKAVAHTSPMCADAGFHALLRAHFDELMTGKAFNFRFAVAGNLDSYKFRAQRDTDTRFEGRAAVRFRVEPDSMLRWFVDPLLVTYDPHTRRLLEYRGVGNVPDPASGKPHVVRIAYYSQPPKDVPTLPPLEP
ncbi:hypothetical protein [Solimonas soli]|uniref:hypothetical protein n=1 Tax=Solimonas soli TaxID=413479 RepID=UPI000486B50F|nr:hypothetical protein [Solimonas soli]